MTNRMELHRAAREKGLIGLSKKGKKTVVTGALALTIGAAATTGTYAAETQPNQVNSTTNATYEVKAGDTFYRIAVTHNMNLAQLEALNPQVTDMAKLKIGQKINLSKASVQKSSSQTTVKQSVSKSTTSTSGTYTVKQGDNMYRIAINHGISLKHLQLLNPQVTGDHITTGQVLKVSGTPFAVKPVEKPQQKVVQTEQIKEVECEVIGLNDENHLYVSVEGNEWVFYAGGKEEVQKDIARYKKGDHLNIKYYQTEHNQFQIKSTAYRGDGQTDLSVDFDGTFVSMDSNSKRVVVKKDGNVISYRISDYLASRNLYFNEGSNVRLVGEKTTNGEIVIENIDK
ncbi:LysM peptidoglycan-binding domain-containing protein [Priestia megaterium]|uniref:LysM peptidoglycan-binding domain-containing protein n=1 Tax=Priestia megaterium TaxID=1404 RepID=A0A6M6DYU7_PRIMG|nr:LysM peptidoglycan-binding domain-containing protein [Priestia megaterium]QJX80081.1 LysM peptidoglycan-binding domain-containing protein [Priestia megaterium]